MDTLHVEGHGIDDIVFPSTEFQTQTYWHLKPTSYGAESPNLSHLVKQMIRYYKRQKSASDIAAGPKPAGR
jgi:hypothetical protein